MRRIALSIYWAFNTYQLRSTRADSNKKTNIK
jgi:hypothetical protein